MFWSLLGDDTVENNNRYRERYLVSYKHAILELQLNNGEHENSVCYSVCVIVLKMLLT